MSGYLYTYKADLLSAKGVYKMKRQMSSPWIREELRFWQSQINFFRRRSQYPQTASILRELHKHRRESVRRLQRILEGS